MGITNKILPLVSIITPLYNADKYIAETIESVINQTYQNWEMIIVDDCSTDESLSIVNKYAVKDIRIILIKSEVNFGGPARPRNIGIRHSKGTFIAFLDADDVWKENKLQLQIDYFLNHPDIDAIHTLADIIDEHSATKGLFQNQRIKNILQLFMEDKNIIYYTNFININTLMIRKEMMINFNENKTFVAIEDWMANILAFDGGKKIHLIKERIIFYRIHGSSISNRASDISYRKIFVMYSTLLLDFKIPIIHFIFANSLNTCKLLKRKMGF